MWSWQRWVRIALAVFVLAFAVVVYVSTRAREVSAPPPEVARLDPKAVIETTPATLRQLKGNELEFEISSAHSLSYADGSARHLEAKITARRPDGRVYVITTSEAQAGPDQRAFELNGNVSLSSDDGFRMETEHGTFSRDDDVARADGAVSFTKGRMSGSGVGATFDQRNDVLEIAKTARVTVTDSGGRTTLEGRADHVALDRRTHALFLESNVRVHRGAQILEADHGLAHLSSDEQAINYFELRGHAQVHGGDGELGSMSAEAIDLDYTEDGSVLERVILNQNASVTTSKDGRLGSRMDGESMEVQLAADGSITEMTGEKGIAYELPGMGAVPARSIHAESFYAGAEAGRGLTDARFQERVVFVEHGPGNSSREVRANALRASLAGQDVASASFTGAVTFIDGALRGMAEEAQYQPGRDHLALSGGESGGTASVSDEHIRVEAHTIEVTLQGHAMTASGGVRTTWSASGTRAGSEAEGGAGKLPALLRSGEATSVNADSLEYGGANGRAVYTGGATLIQGETAIRGDALVLDRQRGDLAAMGSARSTLVLDKGRTDGRAQEIRYDDAARIVTYSATPILPTSGEGDATSATAPAPTLAQLTGPDGDLRARRIQIVLAQEANAVERLEAFTDVTMTLGSRRATGGRLTYFARDEQYVMSAASTAPVHIQESCRETTGQTLTFFKSNERLIVDGNETLRTETKPCQAPSTR